MISAERQKFLEAKARQTMADIGRAFMKYGMTATEAGQAIEAQATVVSKHFAKVDQERKDKRNEEANEIARLAAKRKRTTKKR